jgi:hypothetical protein
MSPEERQIINEHAREAIAKADEFLDERRRELAARDARVPHWRQRVDEKRACHVHLIPLIASSGG